MFSQSLERVSVLESAEPSNLEPKIIEFIEIKKQLQEVGYTQDEIDEIIVEVSHTLPMLEIARKNIGNENAINIEDVQVEIDIASKRITRVIDTKREEA